MADSFTSNLNLTKPEVGASRDTWGTKINQGLDALDIIFTANGTGTSVGINVGAGKTANVAGTLNVTGAAALPSNATAGGANVVTTTGTQTLTNKTLTSPAINTPTISTPTLTGGTIDSAPIGGTTPAAGAFTTLAASGPSTLAGNISTSGDVTLNSVSTERRVNWSLTGRTVYFFIRDSDDACGLFDTGAGAMRFVSDVSGNFTATGNVTAYSDARLKENIETISGALEKVAAMRGVTYTRKDTGAKGVGVLAQEMREIIPEVVLDNGEHLSVSYGNLVGVLIEAVKELSARVRKLEAD